MLKNLIGTMVVNMKFTLKQQRFIQYYNGNASEAAQKAGYSVKTCKEQGYKLFTNLHIKSAINKRLIHRDGVHIATREERQKFWAEVMNNPEIEYNIRLKASELLGKSQADFTENIVHSGDINIYEIMKQFDIETIVGLKNRLIAHVPTAN